MHAALVLVATVIAAAGVQSLPALSAAAAHHQAEPKSTAAGASSDREQRRRAGGVERGIRRCANRERARRGISRLARARVLDRAAELHAQNMARQGFFGHTDPAGRGPAGRVRIYDSKRRFHYVAENIGAGYSGPRAACRGWMRSNGHRWNILHRRYTHVGAGFARGGRWGAYYVQVFARARGADRRSRVGSAPRP